MQLKEFMQTKLLYAFGYRSDFEVGKCFHYGIKVTKNNQQAKYFYKKAAKQGETPALLQLGDLAQEEGFSAESLYYKGLFHEALKEWKSAKFTYKKAVEENHAASMFRLGCLLHVDRYSVDGLECILQANKTKAFHWYRKAIVAYSKEALNFMLKESETDEEASFLLGQMFEQGEIGHKVNIPNALTYYLKAGQKKHQEALRAMIQLKEHWSDDDHWEMAILQRDILKDPPQALPYFKHLADRNNKKAQAEIALMAKQETCAYQLGLLYQEEKNFNEALTYYFQASQKKHLPSLKQIEMLNAHWDDAFILQMGNVYAEVFKDKLAALTCFKRLADKKNQAGSKKLKLMEKEVECLYLLGQLYENDNNFKLAITYYLQAAVKKNLSALDALERLKEHLNQELTLQLGIIYQENFSNLTGALGVFRELADKGHFVAQKRIDQIIENDPEQAFQLGQAYEEQKNIKTAYRYFAIGARNKHARCFEHLKHLADSGHATAQYFFAYEYYLPLRQVAKTIHWCLLAADQGYLPAVTYLKETLFKAEHYFHIAQQYEQGTLIKQNDQEALFFYEKAVHLKHREAAFRLGEWYLDENKKDLKKAFNYFIYAAQFGHMDAYITLERLGEEVDASLQLKLSDLYHKGPVIDKFKAIYWYQQASSDRDPTISCD